MDANGRRVENPKQANHACDAWLYGRIAVGALLPAFQKSEPQGTPSEGTSAPPAPRRSPLLPQSEDAWSDGDGSDGWSGGDGDGWHSGDAGD
jgi:hypothetical protein